MFKNTKLSPKTATLLFGSILAAASLSPTVSAQDLYWHQKSSLYALLPIFKQDIVFLGNSITDGGEFAELFDNPDIKNRGIRGDVITGVEKRLDPILSGKPAKIFLLIGINDISHNLSVAELASRYERLVKRIRTESPETQLYIQSVMPINNTFGRYRNLKNKEQVITDLNKQLKIIASENDAVYIDLTDVLSDKNGRLRKKFTNDGLHLTGAGYKAWTQHIKKYVDGEQKTDTISSQN